MGKHICFIEYENLLIFTVFSVEEVGYEGIPKT